MAGAPHRPLARCAALVVGGCRGIGAQLARALVINHGVGHVAVTGRDVEAGRAFAGALQAEAARRWGGPRPELPARSRGGASFESDDRVERAINRPLDNQHSCLQPPVSRGVVAPPPTVSAHVLDLTPGRTPTDPQGSYSEMIAGRTEEVLLELLALLQEHPARPDLCSLALVAGAARDGLLVRQPPSVCEEQVLLNLVAPMAVSRQFARRAWLGGRGPSGNKGGSPQNKEQSPEPALWEVLQVPPPHARSLLAVGSVAASGGSAGQTAYAAAKAGLGGFVRSLAVELGPRGVRANVLEPGLVRTDMTMGPAGGSADCAAQVDSPLLVAGADASPLGRVGMPEETGALGALMLVGREAGHVTGATWTADGGIRLGLGGGGGGRR